jgi:hypothetical protein
LGWSPAPIFSQHDNSYNARFLYRDSTALDNTRETMEKNKKWKIINSLYEKSHFFLP